MAKRYNQIRLAISAGFSVDNLHNINRITLQVLCDGDHAHAAALLMIAELASSVADGWDGKPIHPTVTGRVQRDLKPKLEGLLDLVEAEASPSAVLTAMNEVANAFAKSICLGLDSDFADPSATH